MPTPLPEAARNMVYALVCEEFNRSDKKDNEHVLNFSENDVYVVWFCYILGNWKALVSTTIPDNMYYEVTFDRGRQKVYIDSYKKFKNQEFEYLPEKVD